MRHPLRRKNLRLRLLPWYVLAGVAVWLAQPSLPGVLLGGAVMAMGASLRVWAAGHLVKTDRLARSGPYAYVRHPLYLGSLLIGIGFAIASGAPAMLAFACVGLPLFLLYYLPYKERIESARLERQYGVAFRAYRSSVPALLPSLRTAARASGRWSRTRVRENNEFTVLIVMLAGVAALTLRTWLAG